MLHDAKLSIAPNAEGATMINQKLKELPGDQNLRSHHKTDYIFKVFCGLLFILITELCLGFYVYRFIAKEYDRIDNNYLLKSDFQQYFLKSAESDVYRQELRHFFDSLQSRTKREVACN